MSNLTTTDGGYYAIKGFTYQFDKSLLAALSNKTQTIEIEQIQDIAIGDYYIQVKHKETQKYSASKIKKAVSQLLECFKKDKTKHFQLYCHFEDKQAQKIILTENELDKILGRNKTDYTQEEKSLFITHFELEFSENFEKQFATLISQIKVAFSLKNEEEAMVHHSIFRANLLDVATKKNAHQRVISFKTLKSLIGKKEKIIFELAYCKYLKNDRYLKYLKKEYFTQKVLNTPNKERLFVIGIDEDARDSDIVQVISNIQRRYFLKHTSPAPYICLLDIGTQRFSLIKQKLWDKHLIFSDGTNFNGDKFRMNDLLIPTHNNRSKVTFKLITLDRTSDLLKKNRIDESFVFLTPDNRSWNEKSDKFKEFFINRTKDVTKIIS
jgi:uncharacterized protein YaaW (UPF0174 family)